MKAAVLRRIGAGLAIDTVPRPDPGPGEVLVRVKACGVCHSDLHAVEGEAQGKGNEGARKRTFHDKISDQGK